MNTNTYHEHELSDVIERTLRPSTALRAGSSTAFSSETCMMDVELRNECSCTMAAHKAIEQRRHCDEKRNIHTEGL
jgi:hypothetical protein